MFSGDFKKCRMRTMARNGSRDLYQPTVTGSKLTIETLEQGVKYVQSHQQIHQSDAIVLVLVSLFLALKIFHTFF